MQVYQGKSNHLGWILIISLLNPRSRGLQELGSPTPEIRWSQTVQLQELVHVVRALAM